MKRSEHRILTTHVGSLIRPAELRHSRPQGGEGGGQEYDSCLRNAVADVVRKQAGAGIDIVSDGEFGKASWAAYILERITGFEIRPQQLRPLIWPGRDRERFAHFIVKELPRAAAGAPTEACIGPITYRGHSELSR